MANSIDQWVQVSREAGHWLWDEVRRFPSQVFGAVAAAGLAVVVAGAGHLLYEGAESVLTDD